VHALKEIVCAYNQTYSEAVRDIPFALFYGRDPPGYLSTFSEVPEVDERRRRRLQAASARLESRQKRNKQAQAAAGAPTQVKLGGLALYRRNASINSLETPWLGPFRVVSRSGPVSFMIEDNYGNSRTVNVVQLKVWDPTQQQVIGTDRLPVARRVRRRRTQVMSSDDEGVDRPSVHLGGDIWTIRKIVGHRGAEFCREFSVDWGPGYEPTWEPASNVPADIQKVYLEGLGVT
jgi:hypothetical protein